LSINGGNYSLIGNFTTNINCILATDSADLFEMDDVVVEAKNATEVDSSTRVRAI
jgi:hypothetical protein